MRSSAPTRRRDWVAPIAVAVLAAAAAFVALDRNSKTAPSRVLFSNCTVNTGEVSFFDSSNKSAERSTKRN